MLAQANAAPTGWIAVSVRSQFDEIRLQVRQLLGAQQVHRDLPQRRDGQRFAYPQLVRITPVDSVTLAPLAETVVAVGKHLSERGLGFYHPAPLLYRHVIATLDLERRAPLAFLIDVSWCRFTRHGWYESGGRFLQAVPPP